MANTVDLLVQFTATTAALRTATGQAKKELGGVADDATKAGDTAGKGFSGKLSSGILGAAKRIAGPVAAMFAADKIKDFFKEAYAEARESQKIGAQTNAVIKSTGGVAGVTAKQIGDLSTAISNKTGIDDEQIQAGENMLLTFKNIKNGAGQANKIFDQTTQIMTDMSVATGKDMTGSAVLLGKALNNPSKGLSALTRVGVTFTDEQAKQIKRMQESGDMMGAQKIILQELKSEFGGSAAAQATAGEKLTTTWKNFQEQIGTALLPIIDKLFGFLSDKLLPILSSFFDTLSGHQQVITIIASAIGVFAGALITILGAIKLVSAVTKAWTAIQTVFNLVMAANPIVLVVIGLIALGAALVIAYKKSETFRKIVNAAFGAVKGAVLAVVNWFKGPFLSFFTDTIPNALHTFTGFFTKTLPNAFHATISWLKKNWMNILGILLLPFGGAILLIIKNWGKIKKTFSAAKDWVAGTWRKAWSGVKNWIGGAVDSGRKAVGTAWTKTRSAFTGAKNWASGTWRKAWSGVKNWISDPIGTARNTVNGLIGPNGKLRGVMNSLDSWGQKNFGKRWTKMHLVLSDPLKNGQKVIGSILGKGGPLRNAFSGFVDAAKSIFARIKGAILSPIRAVVDFINQHLIKGGINWLLGKLGVPKKNQIPWIPAVPKAAGGGPIRGRGTGTSDSILYRLSNNEHVWTAEEVRKFGGHSRMLAFRRRLRQGRIFHIPGMAGGGVVRPVPGGFGAFPSYPGHTGVDFPVGMNTPVHAVMAGVITAVRSLTTSYGKHIIQSLPIPGNFEGLYAHLNSFSVSPGQHVGAGQVIAMSDDTGNSTGPHLHFTLQHPGGNYVDPTSFLNGGVTPSGGGGVLAGILNFLKGLSPVQWLVNKVGGFQKMITDFLGRNPWAQGLAMIPKLIIDKAKNWIGDKLFGGMSGGNPPGSGVERWRSTIETALRMNGLPTSGAYVNAWLRQVQSESGGNPNAVQHGYTDINTITGNLARGLLQVIPPTFNAFKFPGHNNIMVGLDNALAAINYAKHTYPNLLAVIGHGHGYDNGGFLPTGASLAVNRTGRPEPVLSAAQWAAVRNGATTVINIRVDGTLNDDRTIGRLLAEIERYQRRRGPIRLNAQAA